MDASRSIGDPPPALAAEALNRAMLADHLKRVLWMLAIDRVLDVGAFVGDYGAFLRGLGYRGRIVSFEPVGASFEQLERLSAPDPAWTARRLALGARDEERTINLTRSGDFSSLLAPSAYGLEQFAGLSEVERTETVPVARLDGVLAALEEEAADGARTLLKIDTQGFDLAVLEGTGDRLGEIDAVQFEGPVKPVYEGMATFEELVAHLRGRGFELTGVVPLTRDRRLGIIELDCVMIRSRSR